MRCSAFFCFFCVSVFLFVSFSVSFVSVLMKGGGAGDHGWVGGGGEGWRRCYLAPPLYLPVCVKLGQIQDLVR